MALLRLRSLKPVAMAEHARRHTDHYAKAFEGWDGRAFEDLPLLTKEQARAASPYDFLARPYARKVRYYAETTGSVGSPTPSFFTPREFHAATLLAKITPYHDLLLGALGANRTCLNGLTMGFTIAGLSFGDLMANLGGLVANAGSRSTLATPERIARALVRLKPSVVAATPGDFLAWMRIVKEDYPSEYENVVGSLKVLLSTAELCAASRVQRIEEHFGITHVDVYACVEGFFSLPCPCGSKHVLPAYHVEVLDDDLQCIGGTGTGRFVFTNLLKRSTPMVRYLLDDLVTIEPSDCPYGFEQRIVPHGRYELTVRGAAGRIGTRHVEEAIFRRGLFGDYRLVIDDEGARLTLESYGDAEGDPQLEDLLGMPVRCERVAFGALTDFRAVRESKPILRLDDRRSVSDQSVPRHL
jgi:phenylacetate-CoA ligase